MNPTTRPTITVIVNGAAGGGRCGRKAAEVLQTLASSVNLQFEIHQTCEPGEATLIARKAWSDGRRHFWSVGGDGTLFEIVNGLFPQVGLELPRIGVLPLGTGNSFLRDFGIHNAATAIEALKRDHPRRVDVIQLDHDEGSLFFLNLCSIGFSAAVGVATNRWFKPLGSKGYNLAVILCLLGLKHQIFPLTLDDSLLDSLPSTMISFCNSRYTGGTMKMAPQADTADGLMDVIRLGKISRFGLLAAFPKIFSGNHIRLKEVSSRQASRVVFHDPGPMDVLLDGEVYHIVPRSLRVLPAVLDVST